MQIVMMMLVVERSRQIRLCIYLTNMEENTQQINIKNRHIHMLHGKTSINEHKDESSLERDIYAEHLSVSNRLFISIMFVPR